MKTKILIFTFLLLSACANNAGNSAADATNQIDWAAVASSVLQTQMGGQGAGAASTLSDAQIALGLKEALNVGTGNVVAQLGKSGGFNLDPKIRIPLPSSLQKVDSALKLVGMNNLTQDLEKRMNAAAEIATPKAKQLFINSIGKITFADARNILFGNQQDAATQFFRQTMGAQLTAEIQPVINNALADAGAVKSFDAAVGQYANMPLAKLAGVPNVKADLQNYVSNKAVDGIFYYVAQEEAAIRANPAKRTTELLKQVFGAK